MSMAKPCTRCGGIKAPGERLRICETCRSRGRIVAGRWRPALPEHSRTLDALIKNQASEMRWARWRVQPQRFRDRDGIRRPVMIHHGVAVDTADRQSCTEWDDPVFDAVVARGYT